MQGGTTHAGINRLSEVKVDVSETYPGGVAVLPEVHMPFMNINQGSEFVPMTGDDPPALIEQFVLGHIKDLLIHDLRRLIRKNTPVRTTTYLKECRRCCKTRIQTGFQRSI